MKLYSTKRLAEVIDEYIPSERYRLVLKLRLCENIGYEAIGEAAGYSPQWCKELVQKYKADLLSLL